MELLVLSLRVGMRSPETTMQHVDMVHIAISKYQSIDLVLKYRYTLKQQANKH